MPVSPRPLLLLDVDGVLVILQPVLDVDGEVERVGGEIVGYEARPKPGLAPLLARLGEAFDLAWNTRWGDAANHNLGPAFGLSRLPFVDLTGPDCAFNKLAGVVRFAGDRPMAWIDDDLDASVQVWGARRPYPTLLIEADPTSGMTEAHVAQLLAFAASLEG
jgi:hypothetical protein